MERDLGSHRSAWESLGQSLPCTGVPPQPRSPSKWQGESSSPGFLSWTLCTTDNSRTGPVVEACIPGQPRAWVWKSPTCISEVGMLVDSSLKSSQSMGGLGLWRGQVMRILVSEIPPLRTRKTTPALPGQGAEVLTIEPSCSMEVPVKDQVIGCGTVSIEERGEYQWLDFRENQRPWENDPEVVKR